MAAAPSSSSSSGPPQDSRLNLQKQIKNHEVAIAELNQLPSSRTVYQKNGNILFRTSIQKAITSEQRLLNSAKAELEKMNSA